MQRYTISVDFDGTLVMNAWPTIGVDIGAWQWLRKYQEAGALIILHTTRNGKYLRKAIEAIKKENIEIQIAKTKPWAHIYVDDRAFGCPLKQGNVDWLIVGQGILDRILAYNKKVRN